MEEIWNHRTEAPCHPYVALKLQCWLAIRKGEDITLPIFFVCGKWNSCSKDWLFVQFVPCVMLKVTFLLEKNDAQRSPADISNRRIRQSNHELFYLIWTVLQKKCSNSNLVFEKIRTVTYTKHTVDNIYIFLPVFSLFSTFTSSNSPHLFQIPDFPAENNKSSKKGPFQKERRFPTIILDGA